MPRLRIRIELNRGGVGVPLHKLASVVDESQKFFFLLAEDIHIDQSQGEWLGFDFGNEALNFTAEFAGPVSTEQVAAFNAAFDGTTSLRRTTIGQFARITEAIEQDELIGFGLYSADNGDEPSEWRCLSRRDALRITEEIQMLIEASADFDQESHLPAVANTGVGARIFSDRRERALESTKWTAHMREVEANMDRRITRVELALEGQSGLIEDLHLKSTSTEDSVRKLLTAVEGFCAQTTRQLEAISTPTAVAAATALPPSPAMEAIPENAFAAVAAAVPAEPAEPKISPSASSPQAAPEPVLVTAPVLATAPGVATVSGVATAPVLGTAPVLATTPVPAATALETTPQAASAPTASAKTWTLPPAPPRKPQRPGAPAAFADHGKRDWRLIAGFALAGLGVVILGAWAWRNLFSEPPVQRVAATSSSVGVTVPTPATVEPAQTSTSSSTVQTPAPSGDRHITVEASELTWTSLRDAGGNPILAHLFKEGDTQTLDVPEGGTLRVGNAGGLKVLLNGNSIGPLGPRGKVREVTFKNGSYKIVAAN